MYVSRLPGLVVVLHFVVVLVHKVSCLSYGRITLFLWFHLHKPSECAHKALEGTNP